MSSPAVISASVAAGLRRYWRMAWAVRCIVAVAAGSVLANHLQSHGDDWGNFSHQPVFCISAMDGESIVVNLNGSIAPVRLLGLASCNARWDELARQQLDSELVGRKIILQLEPTQTRDARGELLAYAFLDESRTINAELVRQGMLLADRRVRGTLSGSIAQAETEARKKHRGLWESIHEAELPAWRQEWAQREKARQQKLIASAAEQ